MEGWISLYRKSLDSEVFSNANLWQVWCYCLLRANRKSGHRDTFKGGEIILNAGQFITGRFQGAEACNMKPSTFRNQLLKLKDLGNVDIISDNKKSLITIVKYTDYQGELKREGQHKGQEKDTDNKEISILIKLAFLLIESIRKKSSVYSIINKYKNELSEGRLREILADLLKRGRNFETENKLAAYLNKCTRSNGHAKDNNSQFDKPKWKYVNKELLNDQKN